MASALQQQLATIAANSTHQLDLKAQKTRHSKSLLFESRDATGQTFDTIYQICIEGFDELCQLDDRFASFRRNIFSEQSKNEDRTQMTAKENQQLNVVVEQFLGLLCGRVLLRPAIKAAEWLVRRFNVHEYNTEALLLTFLPYHSSQIFPTLLSILPQQLPPTFKFLHPYVTSLQCPPRHAVVLAASKEVALLTALTEYTLKVTTLQYHSTILLGFWTSVAAQAVDAMADSARSGREAIRRQKEEDVILRVLPILNSALKIGNVPELYLGSCMIMMILANKVSLEDQVLNALMEAVVNGWTDDTIENGMMCMAILAEEKELDALPPAVTRPILKNNNALPALKQISAQCRAEILIFGTCLAAINRGMKKNDTQSFELLRFALTPGTLSGERKVALLETMLEAITNVAGGEKHRSSRQSLLKIIDDCSGRSENRNYINSAVRNSKVDPDQLGSELVLKLTSGHDGDEDMDSEPKLLDNGTKFDVNERIFHMENLPALPTRKYSFLKPDEEEIFKQYSAGFQSALSRKDDLSVLLNLPSLQRNRCSENLCFFSFLARTWTSSLSTSVRVRALKIADDQAQQLKTQNTRPLDMQALSPYLIHALSDKARAVRAAAATACASLSALFGSEASNDPSVDTVIWGRSALYGGKSEDLQWLSSADSRQFFSNALLPILQDCVLNSDHVIRALRESINGSSTGGNKVHKELKTKSRTNLCAFLASHVAMTPMIPVKLCLLDLLSGIGKIGSPARINILLPYVQDTVRHSTKVDMDNRMTQLKALIGNMTHCSIEEIQLLKSLAAGSLSSDAELSLAVLERIQHLWKSLKESAETQMADWLLELVLDDHTSKDIRAAASGIMRDVSISSGVLVHLVEGLPSVAELQEQQRAPKKPRTGRGSDVVKSNQVDKDKLKVALQRITFTLELVEGSQPEKHPQLLRGLFYLMSELNHYKNLTGSELVYLHGMLIGGLISVVQGIKSTSENEIDRSIVRADLIIECVRTTTSTQIHQAALLLISSLASWAPDLVLHSVMPLFTFMSSTVLKLNDDYSAHVAEQTVSRVVPPLAASLKKRGKDLISGAAELLLSFTAAFEHIPLQRRTTLFQHLVKTLGAEESLFAIVAMLIERYQVDSKVIPFVTDLMNSFPVIMQLQAVEKYLDLVIDVLKPKRGLSDIILSLGDKTETEVKRSTCALLSGIAQTTDNAILRRRIVQALNGTDADADSVRTTYSELLEKTMQLTLHLRNEEEVLRCSNEVLAATLSLMPTKDFIDSSAKLMQRGSDEIRQLVFTSLERRAVIAKHNDTKLQKVFISVLPNCAVFINKSQPTAVRYVAISCIDQINEHFGKTDRAATMQAAQQVSGEAALGSEHSDLRTISLLCLAGMVESLEDEFIPILPQTLNSGLEYLEDDMKKATPDHALHRAVYGFAGAILDHIPWVLPATQLDRLLKLAAVSVSGDDTTPEKAEKFCTHVAKTVAINECLNAVERTWNDVVATGTAAAYLYIHMLQGIVAHHTKATITKNAQLLFSILLKAFDLRGTFADEAHTDVETDRLQQLLDNVNRIALDVVLKLNDATFRPMFGRLVEWAVNGLPKRDASGTILRCTSLYSFTLTLFEQLKSLVTTYCSYLLENSAQLLQTLSSSNEVGLQLLDLVLQTLDSNFRHDQDGFWQSPAHFGLVVEPLISLLKNNTVSTMNDSLTVAITNLAAAAGSAEHHKSMNSLIMLLMRDEDAAVRLAAIKCERAITDSLNLDWLALLPEMLPFISELQEDDDEDVERETWRWIKQIEEVTGESLEGMLQ